MKRAKRVLMMSVLIAISVAVMFSLSFAQPRIDRGIKPEPSVTIPDEPQIREFSVNPTRVGQAGQVTFRWRVAPGPGGSPITRIRITFGAIELHASSSPSGEARVSLPALLEPGPPGLVVLTATNQAGRFVTSTTEMGIIVGRLNIRIESFTTEPREFSSDEPVMFHITGVNESGELRDVNFVIHFEGGLPQPLGHIPILISGGVFRLNTRYRRPVPHGRIWVEVRAGDQVSRTEFRTETITRYRIAR